LFILGAEDAWNWKPLVLSPPLLLDVVTFNKLHTSFMELKRCC